MYSATFREAINRASLTLQKYGVDVDTGRWQGVPTEGKPDLITRETIDFKFTTLFPVGPDSLDLLVKDIEPNLPWADEHFAERVSRIPSNPGESYKNWPWWRGQFDVTQRGGLFSHTYQERYWPFKATPYGTAPKDRGTLRGRRYRYGTLDDVMDLLMRDPYTRQAYLPVFFPEDTGAVHRGRIPCSLGYHFMLRGNQLNCWYDIRSCDFVRHFRDDIYLTARLILWVISDQVDRELPNRGQRLWADVDKATLRMSVHSLHYHKGDEHHVKS